MNKHRILEELTEILKDNPNDQELGSAIRKYITNSKSGIEDPNQLILNFDGQFGDVDNDDNV